MNDLLDSSRESAAPAARSGSPRRRSPPGAAAPCSGVRWPRPAATIPAIDRPMPTQHALQGDRAGAAGDPDRLGQAVQAVDQERPRRPPPGEAPAPRAPMATPTSAAASAGASLTPSPTITERRARPPPAHRRDLLRRAFARPARVSIAKRRRDGVGRRPGVSPVAEHERGRRPPGAARRSAPGRIGPDLVAGARWPRATAVDGDAQTAGHAALLASAAPRCSAQAHGRGHGLQRMAKTPSATSPAADHSPSGRRRCFSAHVGRLARRQAARRCAASTMAAGRRAARPASREAARREQLVGGRRLGGAHGHYRGAPMVSVPVLSNSSVRARPALQRAAALDQHARRAQRDMPATIATGTARISGHGVATTSTASSPRRIARQRATPRRERERRAARKQQRIAVGQAHHGRARRLGRLDQADDRRIGALRGRRVVAQIESAARVERAAHGPPRPRDARPAAARRSARIRRAAASPLAPPSRRPADLAGPHQQAIAGATLSSGTCQRAPPVGVAQWRSRRAGEQAPSFPRRRRPSAKSSSTLPPAMHQRDDRAGQHLAERQARPPSTALRRYQGRTRPARTHARCRRAAPRERSQRPTAKPPRRARVVQARQSEAGREPGGSDREQDARADVVPRAPPRATLPADRTACIVMRQSAQRDP